MTTIQVRTGRLDDVLESDDPVDLLKIDVEGGELGVLGGARRVLSESHPAIILEHGMGAADFYGTRPSDIYALLSGAMGYEIFTLDGWLAGLPALDLDELEAEFDSWRSYMFVAVARIGGKASR